MALVNPTHSILGKHLSCNRLSPSSVGAHVGRQPLVSLCMNLHSFLKDRHSHPSSGLIPQSLLQIIRNAILLYFFISRRRVARRRIMQI